MAFTKIAAAGIGSTETVTLHSLEVLNNATVGGVLTYEDVTNVDSIGIITARAGVLVGSGITLSKDGDIFATGVTTATTFVGALTGNVTGNVTGDVTGDVTGTASGNPTLSNGSNDRVVTATGANALTGESNLSYNSSSGLVCDGGTIRCNNGFSSDVDLILNADENDNGSGSIIFKESGNETVRISSNGKTGIGTNNPVTKFHTLHSDFQVARFESSASDSNGTYLELYANSPSPADNDISGLINFKGNNSASEETTFAQIRGYLGDVTDATEDGYITFHTRSDGSFAERLRIESDGTTTFDPSAGGTLKIGGSSAHTSRVVIADNSGSGNGNCVVEGGDGSDYFTIQSNGNVQFPNGKGINFGLSAGSGATSSILDDYEEGSFTPTFYGSSTAGSPTYQLQFGRYTKVGNRVSTFVNISVLNVGGAAGDMRIGGFPYAPASGTEGVTVAQWNQLGGGLPSGRENACPLIQGGYTFAELRCNDNDGSSFTRLNVQTISYMRFVLIYSAS